jgi:hypothetical protein
LSLLAFVAIAGLPASAVAEQRPRDAIVKIIAQIRTADYAGDRQELKRLYDQLATHAASKETASRVDYWRGFAMWRRALNGFNDRVDPKELGQDLDQAVAEFGKSAAKDPGFADAKSAECSCLYNLMFLNGSNEARIRELLKRATLLMNDLQSTAPDNPRFLWVLGANQFYLAKGNAEAQKKAKDTYLRGLQSARKQRNQPSDPLEPSWGEAELLMNLAWLHLHSKVPDPNHAEECARSALKLVPEWHYVRDVLLPQILEAKAKAR